MKKAILIIVWLAGVSQVNAQATSDSLKTGKNIIKTDVTDFLTTTNYHLNASWEHLLSKKSSFEVGFYFYQPSDRIIFSQFNLSTDILYRHYFNKQNYQMKGFYMAPYAEFKWAHWHNYHYCYYDEYQSNNVNINYTFLNAGLQAGYQWIYKKKWTIDLYAKAGINLYNNKPKPQYYIHHNSNSVDILWNAGVKIGYKF